MPPVTRACSSTTPTSASPSRCRASRWTPTTCTVDDTNLGTYEYDGVGYDRAVLAGVTVGYDAASDEWQVDADDDAEAFGTTVLAASAAPEAVVFILHVTDDTDSWILGQGRLGLVSPTATAARWPSSSLTAASCSASRQRNRSMAFSNVQTTVLDLAGGGSDSVAHDTAGAYNWIAVAIEGGEADFTATVTYGGQSIAQKATDRTGISYRGDGRSIVFARVASDGSMPSAGSNTFAVTITGSPEACKARIWTGLATNPAILSDHDSAVNATATASVAFGSKAGMAFMAACVGGSGSSNIWDGYGSLDQDLTTLSWTNVVPVSHGVLAATDTTTTGTVTFSWYATAVMVALLGIVEGDVVIEPGRVGEAVSFRAGLTITAPSDGTVFLTRLGERVRWRAGLRITSTAKRQVALVGGGIQTPEMTEGGTEGQVLTQHATRKPTWEDAGGGVTDHGALTGLADDDHGAYALMVSQDAEPSDPARPEALWYDSDAEPSPPAGYTPGDGIAEGTSFPLSPTTGDLFRRTDLERHVYEYDGTRWLTVLTFAVQGPSRNNDTASPFDYHAPGCSPFPQPENGIYLERVVGSAYVTTTNDGSRYWRYLGPDTTTVLWTTAGISPSTYTRILSTAAAGVYTVQQFRFRIEKVSTPGSIYGAVMAVCRGIGT